MDEAELRDPRAESLERETIRRVFWRIMPLIMLGTFVSALDRGNVGMAALTMNRQLGLTASVFGFGAGIFYLGYLGAEIPSNLILHRFGARLTIARIQFIWAFISGFTAFVWSGTSFIGIRFLLGMAEAGYFPGVLLYMTWWFPSRYRSRMVGTLLSANLGAQIIGPPIGGVLLQMHGLLGLAGWQWLFLIEALPALILSAVTFFLLTDRPKDATWLNPEQRGWLISELDSERRQREAARKYSLAEVFINPRIWLLASAFFFQQGAVGAMFFLPQIVRGLGLTNNAVVGLIAATPYFAAAIAMVCWGWHSDRTGERLWHAVSGWVVASAGLAACTLIGAGHPMITMAALIIATMGQWAVLPAFWALPSGAILSGAAAAAGIALITSVGGLGGWLGPVVFGLVKDATGSDNRALLVMALAPLMSACSVLLAAGHGRPRAGAGSGAPVTQDVT